MRKSLYAFAIVTGILAVIVVLFPGVVFLGIMLSPIVGYILAAVPMAFLIGGTFLIGGLVLGGHGRTIAILVPTLILAAVSIALPMVWNRSTNVELRGYSEGDRTPSKIQISANTIALLTPDRPLVNPTECTNVCQRLLFNKSVQAVLMGRLPIGPAEPSLDGDTRVMSYRIERRSSCPPINIPDAGIWDDEYDLQVSYYFISDRVKRRIAAGECLIAELANVSEADIVIVDQSLKQGVNPCNHPWRADLDTVTARRLSVRERKDGSLQEIFRQTAREAYPIFVPLFVAPGGNCPSDVMTGIGRKRLSIGYYNLPSFFKTSTNLNVGPVEDVTTAR